MTKRLKSWHDLLSVPLQYLGVVHKVREIIANGEIIKGYLEDKYWPSYLIYDRASEGRTLHGQFRICRGH